MILKRLLPHLNESMNVDGDIIEFGTQHGETFKHLVACAMANDRIAVGLDSFVGMGEPTAYDKNAPVSYPKGKFAVKKQMLINTLTRSMHNVSNYEIVEGFMQNTIKTLDDKRKYAFTYIDVVHYYPTKMALEYMWDKMSYGGTIYLDNYDENSKHLCSLAINRFISEHRDEIIASKQMLINGSREKDLAIKCLRLDAKPEPVIEKDKRGLVVAMVLKTGGIYNHQHVNNLARSLKKYISVDFKLTCITDNSRGVDMDLVDEVIPFKHNFPKWWGKIELFRPDLFQDKQVLYFDLDTFVIDNIDDLAKFRGTFSGLRDFFHLHSLGSGLMSWNANKATQIYRRFMGREQKTMNNYREGDQRWIDEHKPAIQFIQDLFPKKVVSYKVHCKKVNSPEPATIPDGTSVVCFHGEPRPHNVVDAELKKYWNP